MMTEKVDGHWFAVILALASVGSLGSLAFGDQQPLLLEANNPVSLTDESPLVETVLPTLEIEQRPLGAPQESRALDIASGNDGAATNHDNTTYDPTQSEIVRVGLALGGVLALILLLRAVLRRMGATSGMSGALGGRRPSGVLEVLGRFPTGRKQSMVLLKLGRRLVLVHQTPTGMQSLAEVVDPDEVAALLTRVEAGQVRFGGQSATSAIKRIFSRKKSAASKKKFSKVLDAMHDDPWEATANDAPTLGDVDHGQDVQSVLARASRREASKDGSELVDLTRVRKSNTKSLHSHDAPPGGEQGV